MAGSPSASTRTIAASFGLPNSKSGRTPGPGKVLLDLEEPGQFCAVLEPQGLSVAADKLFIDHVEELVGLGAVRVID